MLGLTADRFYTAVTTGDNFERGYRQEALTVLAKTQEKLPDLESRHQSELSAKMQEAYLKMPLLQQQNDKLERENVGLVLRHTHACTLTLADRHTSSHT